MTNKINVITVDGPSGAGKGTLTQMLAEHLNWHILDSGALYRILGVACERAGINKRHGLRHAYAQRRYHELTGFACAVAHNGLKQSMMTAEQRRIDRVARLQVSQELGHSRKSIVNQYLGR